MEGWISSNVFISSYFFYKRQAHTGNNLDNFGIIWLDGINNRRNHFLQRKHYVTVNICLGTLGTWDVWFVLVWFFCNFRRSCCWSCSLEYKNGSLNNKQCTARVQWNLLNVLFELSELRLIGSQVNHCQMCDVNTPAGNEFYLVELFDGLAFW